MISFRKGQFFTLEKIVHENGKNFIKIGQKLIAADVQGQVKEGDKLVVTQVSSSRIQLTPYSKLFKNRALDDILNSFNIPIDSKTYQILQAFLTQEAMLSHEKLKKAHLKTKEFRLSEKMIPLLPIRENETNPKLLDKLLQSQGDALQMAITLLGLSSEKEILLPVDPDGSFIFIQPAENRFNFSCMLYFESFEWIYIKGFLTKEAKNGEVYCYSMRFMDSELLNGILEDLKTRYPQIYFSRKSFNWENIRGVDGFF